MEDILNLHKDNSVHPLYTAIYNKHLHNYLSIYDIMRNGIVKLVNQSIIFFNIYFPVVTKITFNVTIICFFISWRKTLCPALPWENWYSKSTFLLSGTALLWPHYPELLFLQGTAVAQWLRCCATKRKVAGSIPFAVIDIKFFRSHYGPGAHSASNRNEYQEHFLGVKEAGA